MKKIMVIGCPGSGKSTFAKKLHTKTALPLYHLDMLYWNEDKTTVERKVFLERLSDVLQKDEWIIDGNYGSTMELRIQSCDTIFFLDYPLEICLDGIKARRGKPRSDMPWSEKSDEEDFEFLDFVKKPKRIIIKSIIMLAKGEKEVNVLKLMALMGLAVKCGDTVTVTIDGADEDTCAPMIETFFNENF